MTMNALDWRWIGVGLLAANAVLFILGQLGSEPPPTRDGEMPALDPALPIAELVEQPRGQSEPTSASCYTIGPLPTLLAQQRAVDRLRSFSSEIAARQTMADSDRGWWVYLPTNSRNEALAMTRRLAERGVEDYYVVAGGDLENAVSVGLYENIENARQRQRQIRAMGFDAQLEVRRENAPQFWVDYRVEPGESPPWRFIVRASPGAQRLALPCSDTRPIDSNGA